MLIGPTGKGVGMMSFSIRIWPCKFKCRSSQSFFRFSKIERKISRGGWSNQTLTLTGASGSMPRDGGLSFCGATARNAISHIDQTETLYIFRGDEHYVHQSFRS